jgi:hypothetical protein
VGKKEEGCGMNFETQVIALGLIRSLRANAPQLDEAAELMPLDLRIAYRTLLRRALEVTEATTWGQVESFYQDWLAMAERCGMTPTAEMN